MPTPFDQLTQAERVRFWQEIEAELSQALDKSSVRISTQTIEETRAYLEHNELGLAWETICEEFVQFDVTPSQTVQALILETGKQMSLDDPENHAHDLWKEIVMEFEQLNQQI
jgi:hypothetical protein